MQKPGSLSDEYLARLWKTKNYSVKKQNEQLLFFVSLAYNLDLVLPVDDLTYIAVQKLCVAIGHILMAKTEGQRRVASTLTHAAIDACLFSQKHDLFFLKKCVCLSISGV